MASNKKMLDAIRLYLERLNIAVGGGGRPILYGVGKTIPAGGQLELDIKTVFPDHAKYDLLSSVTTLRVLQSGKYISNVKDVNLGIRNDGTIVISNTTSNTVTVQYRVTSPTVEDSTPPKPEPIDGVLFVREVPTTELITGDALGLLVGLDPVLDGIIQFSNEPWLEFELDGKTLYVAKKPYRHSAYYDRLNEVGVITGKTVTIKGKQYKCRVLELTKGKYEGQDDWNYNPISTYDTEWNRLMYAVYNGEGSEYPGALQPGPWPLYSDADLITNRKFGDGSATIGNKVYYNQGEPMVGCRGWEGLGLVISYTSYFQWADVGWRPVLEPI